MNGMKRRQVLAGIGTTAAIGLAGCSGDDGEDDGETTRVRVEAPQEVQDYLSNVSNFGGEMVDAVDASQVQIDVGAEGNGANLAFDPAAVQIETGTEVDWEWTGNGGRHNVVEEDETFDSGNPVNQEGKVFSHTFENEGIYLYYCAPHKVQGMKGAIVVE